MATIPSDRASFPQILMNEVAIFKRWLLLHQAEYTRFDYNETVGLGQDPGPTVPDNYRQMAIRNSQRRIDAVGYKDLQPTIIEIKDRIGLSAVGQLLAYRTLYAQKYTAAPPAKMLVVGAAMGPDVIPILNEHAIAYELV